MYVVSSGVAFGTLASQLSFHLGMLACLAVLAVLSRAEPLRALSAGAGARVDASAAALLALGSIPGALVPSPPGGLQVVLGVVAGVGMALIFSSWFSVYCAVPVRDAFCYVLLGFSAGALGCLALVALEALSGTLMAVVACALPVASALARRTCAGAVAPSAGTRAEKGAGGGAGQVVVLCLQIAVYAVVFGNGFVFSVLQGFIPQSSDGAAIRLFNYGLRFALPLVLFAWMALEASPRAGTYRPLFSTGMLVAAFLLLGAWFVGGLESVVAYGMVSCARSLVLLLIFLACIKLVAVSARPPSFVFGLARGAYEFAVLVGMAAHAYLGRLLDVLDLGQGLVYATAFCVLIFLTSCFFATAQGLDGPRERVLPDGGGLGAEPSPCAALCERHGLNGRETEILTLFWRGFSKKRIVATVGLSENTVRWYLAQLYTRLGIHSRDELLELVEKTSGA